MDSVFLREWALHGTLSPRFFLLQFVLICLFWELAQCLGSRWSRPGPSPNVFLQVRFHVAVLSPSLCQALARPLSHVPSLLTWAGSLSRDWSRCQRSSEHKDKEGGASHPPQRLNIPRQNSPDLFIVLCVFGVS